EGHPLLLWQPDETTQAMAELYFPAGRWRVLDAASGDGVSGDGARADARVLSSSLAGSWRRARWSEYLRSGTLDDSVPPDVAQGLAGRLAPGSTPSVFAGLAPAALLERPGGRGYVLWQPLQEPVQ
ncbi:MAG: hypothetical protein RL684_740, partial [Pseudomonadota bacterium]